MFKQAFANFTDGNLAVIGFLLFLAVFLGVLVWTFFIVDAKHLEKLADHPMKNGD